MANFNEFDDDNSYEKVNIVDKDTPSQGVAIDDQGRLKISAEITAGAVGPPADPASHFIIFPTNGGSRELNVNGSVTPVEFTVTVPANEVWYIRGIGMNLVDSTLSSINNFGNISGPLTNGVLVELVYDGTAYEITTLTSNTGLLHSFHEVGSDIFTASIFGFMPLDPSMTLNTGDTIRVTIRDNLTGLDQFRISLHAWRVIS